jgi:hypothetical protein
MIVLHFAKVSVLYPCVVISSLIGRLENILFLFFTLPLVYAPEITTYCYNGLIQEYVVLCYDFPNKGPTCTAKVFLAKAPLAPCGSQVKYHAIPHSPEQDRQPIVFLISKEVIPYWTCGDTCCPRVCTPKIQSLIDSSNHIT